MLQTETRNSARWRTAAFAAWAIVGFALIAYGSVLVLGRISSALAPFILASLFVFLLRGGVVALERRGVPRLWAAAICLGGAVVTFIVALVFLIPPVVKQVVSFVDDVPRLMHVVRSLIMDLQGRFSDVVIPVWLEDSVSSLSKSVAGLAVDLGDAIARGAISAGGGVATVLFDLFMAVVISFWILKDLPKMRTELRSLVGHKYEDDLENLIATVARVVGGYLKGQTIASVITGIAAWIGLSLLGVRYALVLGIITLIFNYIPYIGPFFAGTIAAVVGLFTSPLTSVLAIVVVIVAQQLTDLFVTPRVMSEQVDLHPTIVIFSLLVGGTLLGFWGMIFAIPVAATAKGLFVYYYELTTKRSLATEDGALFRTSCKEDDESPDAVCEDVAGPQDTEHPGSSSR